MKQLMAYQEVAVDKLIRRSRDFLSESGREIIVFQAPTGAGKTFMATKYMEELTKEVNSDLCFLWISIGKGELHKQSMKAVSREISNEMECSLLEEEFFGSRTEIHQNEIVFVSWQKIKLKDGATGNWKAVVMKDKETINFIEVLENTRALGRKIILIIDESHAGAKTKESLEIIDHIIKPDLQIEMSATPIVHECDARVVVDATDVIEAGIIKKEVIINKDLDKLPDDDMDSGEFVLFAAFQKREELARRYREQNSNVNPLVLIQLPNSRAGEDIRIFAENFLREHGVTEENGKLAIWLSDEKVNNESDKLLKNDGRVEFLLFKQAIDTGWDCPRAQIMVRFRETDSLIFEIQTVGRILRMPEAKHYLDDELNTAFVYTNIKSIEVQKETYNPNIIKSCKSSRRTNYEPICLRSYYRPRIDFGDVTSSYTQFFCDSFAKTFGLDAKDEGQDHYENIECLKKRNVIFDFSKMDTILTDGKIEADKLDESVNEKLDGNVIDLEISEVNLQYSFEKIIRDNLNGFAPRRSISTVKTAIVYAMRKFLGLNVARGGMIYIQNLVVRNEKIFSMILDESIKKYKIYHEEEVSRKTKEKWNDSFEIEESKNYNPKTTEVVRSKLSLYQPLYLSLNAQGKVNELEESFLNYLEEYDDIIDWIWVNGSEHMEKNFGIKVNLKKTFQPDFLVKFRDGRIGIFDTKGGMMVDDDRVKSNALQRYIFEERNRGKDIFGGLVVKDGQHFRVFVEDEFVPFKESPERWEYFDNILL